MGTDIHAVMQVREGDGWNTFPPPAAFSERNYCHFALLAGVRNGTGFAGVKTGAAVIPSTAALNTRKAPQEHTAPFLDSPSTACLLDAFRLHPLQRPLHGVDAVRNLRPAHARCIGVAFAQTGQAGNLIGVFQQLLSFRSSSADVNDAASCIWMPSATPQESYRKR